MREPPYVAFQIPTIDAAPTHSSTGQSTDPYLVVCDNISLRDKNIHLLTNKPTLSTGRNVSLARNIMNYQARSHRYCLL